MHEIDSDYILHDNVILELFARPFQVVDETHQKVSKKGSHAPTTDFSGPPNVKNLYIFFFKIDVPKNQF